MDKAAVLVEEARKWCDPPTPYHHQADILGLGVDCAMILVRIACDTGIAPLFDPRPYPVDWHLHRSDERYLRWVEQYADKIPDGAAPQPGDIPLFKFGRCLSHGGIVETVLPEPIMIHADMAAGQVERCEVRRFEERLAGYWRIRA